MKNLIKVGVALSALAALMASAAASSVTGIWHGRLTFDSSKMPNSTGDNERKLAAVQAKHAQSIKITLTLKGDSTFTIVTIGGPNKGPVSGTYTAAGNTVTIYPSTAGKAGKPTTFTLSQGTKSMSMSQGPMTMTFTR